MTKHDKYLQFHSFFFFFFFFSSSSSSSCMAQEDAPPREADPPSQDPADDKMCRICFGGPDDTDNGRLISPCLCSGSMRYVHTGCLHAWRKVATGASSFWKCDQCGFRYHLERTRISGLAQNKLALASLTFVIFIITVLVSGYIAAFILSTAYSSASTHTDDGITYSSALTDTVSEAARVLADASGTRVHPVLDSVLGRSKFKDSLLSNFKNVNKQNFFKLRNRHFTTPYSGGRPLSDNSPYSSATPPPPSPSTGPSSALSSLFQKLIAHIGLGLSFLGIISFLQLLISLSLLGPLHHFRNPLMRGIRRGRNTSNGNLPSLNGFLIVVFVFIGIIKAVYSIWKFIGRVAKWTLVSMENAVLEVNASPVQR